MEKQFKINLKYVEKYTEYIDTFECWSKVWYLKDKTNLFFFSYVHKKYSQFIHYRLKLLPYKYKTWKIKFITLYNEESIQ